MAGNLIVAGDDEDSGKPTRQSHLAQDIAEHGFSQQFTRRNAQQRGQTLLGVVKTFYGHQCGDIHGKKILRLFFDQGQDFARQAPFGGDITHANIGADRHNFECLNRRHGSTIFIGNQQRIEKVGITASDTRSGSGETAGDHQFMRRAGNRRATDNRTHTDNRSANLFERTANSWNRENRADAGDRIARTNDDRLRAI